jgi:hypothetical protein
MNHTTRRFPRTLADAFPDERYPTIEHHRNPSHWCEPVIAVMGFVFLLSIIVPAGWHMVARWLP